MGIDGFKKYLATHFAKAYFEERNVFVVDHILIDLNSLLYTCARKCTTEVQLFKLLFRELDFLFRDATRPTGSVFIAVDGPASLAKLRTQRVRREKKLREQVRSVALPTLR
jgi:5'-3' exonuclease